MSEQDNLPKADGKKEEVTPITEQVESQTEAPIETKLEITETADEDEKVISEIDESNAEDAEDEGNADRHVIDKKDYEKMSMEALADELEKLVNNEKVQAIKTHVEEIRTEFKSKFSSLLDEKKEEFLNEGGNIIDFHYSSHIQKRFKDSEKEYRTKITAHYKNIEKSLKDNLAERLDIIEGIKGLINAEENINTTYKHFKDLQERWRNAGPIPRDKYNNAWNSYHFNVERFYDLLHLDRDLRDKDFNHNLEQKVKIIVRAEELAQDDNLNRAFRELQVLHKMWKEELGPVDKKYREEIWNRFKTATKTIHDKRQVYFNDLEKVYEENLKAKQEIIENISQLGQGNLKSHSAWQNKIKELETLRNSFFSAGKVPLKVNEETWAAFKNAVRNFNRTKNNYYKSLKKSQYENLQKKLELIKIAEDNKDSEDFEVTTALMKKIQSDWKKIGHVPRKFSDDIWKRFKDACNYYFDRLHAQRDEQNKEQLVAVEVKKEFLEQIKTAESLTLEEIKEHVDKWRALGALPRNVRHLNEKFNKAIDTHLGKLNMSKVDIEMMKFKNVVETYLSQEDYKKLDNEQYFIRKKIDESVRDMQQLENNLSFISNAKDDNPLVHFKEAGYTNDTSIIRQNPKVTAINSAIEIDITGQVCADTIGKYQYSGVGGQMDFIRGASLSKQGKAIFAMPSTTTKGISKITPFLKEGAGVTTTRAHVHYVATEYGVVNLFGKSLKQRAKALISIAHPNFREELEREVFNRFH